MDTIAERLRAARKASGTTQTAIAKALGVQQATVSHWCRGKRTPTIETLERAAAVLGVRSAWLTVGDGEMHEKPRSARRSLARTKPSAATASTTRAA